MKPLSLLAGYLYGICSLIVLPLFIIYINETLGFPRIEGFVPEITGLIVILLGGILLFISTRAFRNHGGKGSPLPFDPPQRLVTQGIYRFSRNPMFVATGMIWIGEFLFFGSLLLLPYALGWIVFNHIHLIKRDEIWLEKRFGRNYLEYKKHTPRYFPKLVYLLQYG